ncbi:MAG: ABC transporter permease [Candidatus Excrementavichristensenella sp.]|jgi:ribose/xylose/arabinose/galactoside ABC-type transport system permease subunit
MENKKSQGLQLRDLSSLLKRFGLLFVLILMFLVMTIVSDVFLTTNNIINVLRQISINGVLAVGLTFVILTGGIDLSVGSLVAVTSVIAGNLLEKEMNVPLVLFLSIGAAVLFGVFNGVLISYFMLPPFIATLATQTIGRGFSLVYSDGRPYTIKNEMYKAIGKGVFIGIPIPVWIMFFVIVIALITLRRTTFGRHVYAFGGNRNAAKLSGVKIRQTEMATYIISALCAGLAGTILSARISSGQPTAGEGYELDAIAAVAIGGTSMAGGTGHLGGTILGFIIIGVLSNSLTILNVSSFYQDIVKGFIIIFAVLMDMRTKRSER